MCRKLCAAIKKKRLNVFQWFMKPLGCENFDSISLLKCADKNNNLFLLQYFYIKFLNKKFYEIILPLSITYF